MRQCAGISRQKKVAGVALAVVMLLGSISASAQWAVFDAANFGENIQSAMENARQYQQMVQQYQAQIEEYQRNFQQLRDFGEGVSGARDQYRAHRDAIEDLYGSLQEGSEFMNDLYRDFALSDAETWEEYHEIRARQEEQGQARAKQQMEHATGIMDKVEQQYEEVERFESQARTIDGQTQGFQQLSSQMALISRQNAQMTETLAQRNMQETAKIGAEEARSEGHRKRMKEKTEAEREWATERSEAADEFFLEQFGDVRE
ncbi:hypothetical protein [Thioalkalivibrio sp. ALE23]|uniref:hypothetical protein n=1 Tax=Thioalkalivibrio sp. ALE23 TaxID=1265495 RepID=UPI00037BB4BE|nr:hypothetical protein [Thioalkalivibrio sp. ALE23]